MPLTEEHFRLLDELVSDFGHYSEPGKLVRSEEWVHIGPKTQEALEEVFNFLDELFPDFQPCECGVRDVVCAECGEPRGRVEA